MKVTTLLALCIAACSGPEIHAPVAIDGDTFRAGATRYRLLRIDTPEMPGHCRRGRRCVPGDSYAAKEYLATLLELGPVRCDEHGQDRYGRTLAECWVEGFNISDEMIRSGHAEPYGRK